MRSMGLTPKRACAALLALAVLGMSSPAFAQGQFEARYKLSMAGISIGRLAWRADFNAAEYSTSASGRASGIFSILVSGEGNVQARGVIKDGRLQPVAYNSSIVRENEISSIRMRLDSGRVRDLVIEEPEPESDRLPVTDAHKQNVLDPLTAFLIPAAAGDPLAASGCERTLSIFDGRRRYDLVLAFRRLDKVRTDKGYAGPALVCAMKLVPIAGHRPSSPLLRYLSEGRDIEVWFVPVAGARVLAPFRLSVASLIGNMVLEAEEFATAAPAVPGKP